MCVRTCIRTYDTLVMISTSAQICTSSLVFICVSPHVVVHEFLEMPRSASTELTTIDPRVRAGHVGASLVIDELIIT